MNAPLVECFRALVNIFQNGGQVAHELMETRCDRGAEIARKMRFSENVVEAIRKFDEHWLKRVALLLDIGKLGVNNSILDKPGKLDPEEWTAMHRHSRRYPRGICGDSLPREVRIVTTTDVFDALTADRP